MKVEAASAIWARVGQGTREEREAQYELVRQLNRAEAAGDATSGERILAALGALVSAEVLSKDEAGHVETLLLGTAAGVAVAAAPQAALGLLVGYLIASWGESFFHDHIQHASPELRAIWKKLGPVGEWLRKAYKGHSGVHHGSTYKKDHVTKFGSAEAETKLRDKLERAGDQEIVRSGFGVSLTWMGVARYLAPIAPAHLAAAGVAAMLGAGPAYFAGAVAAAMLGPLASKFLHPYLHMDRAAIEEKAGPLMRRLLETDAVKWIARHHFVHHARREGCNFNLLPGGDLLRGAQRPPTTEEFAEMRSIGMLV